MIFFQKKRIQRKTVLFNFNFTNLKNVPSFDHVTRLICVYPLRVDGYHEDIWLIVCPLPANDQTVRVI